MVFFFRSSERILFARKKSSQWLTINGFFSFIERRPPAPPARVNKPPKGPGLSEGIAHQSVKRLPSVPLNFRDSQILGAECHQVKPVPLEVLRIPVSTAILSLGYRYQGDARCHWLTSTSITKIALRAQP